MLPNAFHNAKSCCFTGHRPPLLPGGGDPFHPEMDALYLRLTDCVTEAVALGVRCFYAGGAQGFDMLAEEAVLRARALCPEVRLVLSLPSRTQADLWREESRARYLAILSQADEAHYASERSNTAFTMHARSRYMVDHADCCIGYLRRLSGGTFYAAHYAIERGVPFYNLAEARP